MAYRRSLDFLPNVFRTEVNDKFLNATIDQLISEPELKRVDGYVGRRFSPVAGTNDSFINEPTTLRQDYQLEPHTTFVDADGKVKFTAGYVDLLRRIDALGGFTDDHSRLFSSYAYNYDGFIDYDKFLNYSSYYWLPNGPDSIEIFATEIPLEQDFIVNPPSLYQITNGRWEDEDYDVLGFDVSENSIARVREDGISFDQTGNRINPTIRLARGGVYNFIVNQTGHGFYIQTAPGTADSVEWQDNLSTRDVLGVENNGEDVGVVTFKVPSIDAQNFLMQMPIITEANVVAHSSIKHRSLRYSEIQYKKYDDIITQHGGIDGQRMFEGKKLIFLRDPATGKNPQPWNEYTDYYEGDLIQYGNVVYRVLEDFRTDRLFSAGKLEVYDLQNSWYNPDPFDSTKLDSQGFDMGDTVPYEQQRGIFNVTVNADGYVVLIPGLIVPRNNKVKILEGTKYGNREVYRDSNDDIIVVPLTTANLDRLYYADSIDPNIGGVIEIVDQDNNLKIDVVGSILGKKAYTSPNGVAFTNGLKVKFLTDALQPEYIDKTYYVEGVGTGIKLVDTETLLAEEPWLDVIDAPFDIYPYDSEKYAASTSAPLQPDYFVMNRASIEKSAWTRHNRWFHQDVIELTNRYNNYTTIVTADFRAKRPILEFDPNLQLFKFGQVAKKAIDVIDIVPEGCEFLKKSGLPVPPSCDVFSNIEGKAVRVNDENIINFTASIPVATEFRDEKIREGYYLVKESINNDGIMTVQLKLFGSSGYYVDRIPLTPGMRVIFTADTDPDVRNKIYEVQWIKPQNSTEDRVWTFVGNGSAELNLNYDVTDASRLEVYVNGVEASDQEYFWSYREDQKIVFSNIIPPVGSNITVALRFEDQLHFVLAPDSAVEAGDCVFVRQGLENQGKMFHFDGENWIESQQKTKVNQPPNFDLFDSNKKSFGDPDVYASTTFTGNKLFSYEIGSGSADKSLGLRLKYRNINNIGDILFADFINKDNFTYRSGQQSVTVPTVGARVKENRPDKSFVFRNQWRKSNNTTKQYQLQSYFATDYQKNLFLLNVQPEGVKDLQLANIVVYVNNALVYTNRYDLQIEDKNVYLMFDTDLKVGDKLDIKVYSKQVNAGSVFEVPFNFTNNPFNKEIVEVTLGQMRNHISHAIEDISNLSDEFLTPNNLRDTPNVKSYLGSIVQHEGAPHLANFLLNDTDANFVNAVINAQREYVRFKNRFIQLAGEVAVVGETPSQTLERIMSEMVANKNKNFAYFTSDMIAFGNDFTRRTYTVVDDRLDTYDISYVVDLESANEKCILVYINGRQLAIGRDYTFSTDRPVLILNLSNISLKENDVIEVREYITTDGSYLPPTPSKLGLYPVFIPETTIDGYGENARTLIKGHDGSLMVPFNDYRDAVILEFETRIYNNIKTKYNTDRFDLWDYIPGAFRKTDYTRDEYNSLLSSHFSAWSGSNSISVSDYRQFEANDPFTYNYGRFTNRLDGTLMPASYWRGLYRYYYDTDAPHLRPWEMLGFPSKPNWWEEYYGPAPYTSGNTVLWDDLEAGFIVTGDRQGIDIRFARPGLKNIIPVDLNGELLSPLDCLSKDINELDVSGFYKFGDGGPVETAWRQSSEFPFVLQIAIALMKPASYFGLNIDTNRQVLDLSDNQLVLADTGMRNASSMLVQNEVDENGHVYRSNGYITWISEYCKSRGLDVTRTLGNKIRNLESRLGYKVAGYTDKKYIRVITEQYTPASNNPGIIIPDDDFDVVLNKSAPVYNLTYSGVIVTKTADGWSVTGYDDNKPYFTIEESAQNNNKTYIKVGKLAITKYYDGTGQLYRVPYGTEFFSLDQMGDFLISYGRYLTRQGFQFTNKMDEDANWYQDWDLAVREFLFYQQQGWDADIAISLSPVGSRINYRSPFGVVDGLSNRPLNTRILDEDFNIVRASEYTVYRGGRDFNAKVDNSRGIYLLDLDVVEYEHVLIFNNKTRFNDIIYDPVTGDRQHRLRLQGFKTADWDGTYNAAGFVINDDNIEAWSPGVNYNKGDIVIFKEEYFTASEKIAASLEFNFNDWIATEYNSIKKGLLPNLANRAGLYKNFYNTNEVNLEQDAQKLGKNLIGFESRKYMEDLGISDTSQFKFYQGMISQKGTNSSLGKLLNAKVDNFGGYANVYEEWALRVGTYGATDSTRNLQIELDEAWAIKDPLVLEMLNPNDKVPTGHKGLKSKELYIKHVPYDKNFLNFRTGSKDSDLYSAGYAQLSDVDYASPTRATLNNYVTDENVGSGDLIWIAADRNNQWNVYRIEETDIRLETANIVSNGNATIRCVNNHGLVKNDLIYLVSDNTVPNVLGFYTVQSIMDARTFVISTGFGAVQINPFAGFVYKLKSMRFESAKEIADREPLKGWKPGDTLFVDNATNDGWAIYKNENAWDVSAYYKSSYSEVGDNLGYSVATDPSNYYMIAGRPGKNSGAGDVVIYSMTMLGTLEEIAVLSTDSDGTVGMGSSVTTSTDMTFAAGGPQSGDIGYVAIFVPNAKTGDILTQQVIAAETTDSGGEFGFSVKLSDDGNWLVVGQPGIDEGYVHVYQRRFISTLPSATGIIYGDGSSTSFVLTGTLANPQDTNAVEVIQDGITLVPFQDYEVTGSILTINAAPMGKLEITVTRGTPKQSFTVNGSTNTFVLAGDNASPSSIYTLFVEVDQVIQVPFKDFILTNTGGVYRVVLTQTPEAGIVVDISQRTGYELVTSFTSDLASIGDRFGHSIDITDDAKQIIIGAPNTEVDGVAGAGRVYVFDRTSESFYADGTSVEYTTDSVIEGYPLVYVDGQRVLDFVWSDDTVTFMEPPLAGSIIRIDTNGFAATSDFSIAESDSTVEEDARFGESVVVCPNNCSVYVGAPGHTAGDNTNGGQVYRFINQARLFGNISGTVVNPVITQNSTLNINNFTVQLYANMHIAAIVNAINAATIPGVTAYNDGGYIYIETNSVITADKLHITQLSGNALADMGIIIYPHQQTIDSPDDEHYVEFGRALSIGTDADVLVIGSARGATRVETTIDGKKTYFDARATAFNDIRKQSGAVWVYQYIPTANTTVDNPGQFIAAQRLSNVMVDPLDAFGTSVAINQNTIYVGAPGDDTDALNAGMVLTFVNMDQNKTWKVVRSEQPKVDIDLINRVFLYNKDTNVIVADLDYIDPIKGKISGFAAQEIAYQTPFDPAVYNSQSSGRLWGKEFVGVVWWDISQTRWMDYEQGSVGDRGVNWNTAFPGSTIVCYEWIESTVPPSQFFDEKDTTAYARSTQFNLVADIDPNTGVVTNRYYYWVAGKRTIPTGIKRRYSTVDIENLIANPRTSGIPFIAFIASNAVALYNVSNLLQNKSIVLNIEYDVKLNENSIHSEYQLLAENDATSLPNDRIVQKLIDSLAGTDPVGNLVPDIKLTVGEMYGPAYRPRQTMFRNRKEAVKTAISYINLILASVPARDKKDVVRLLASEPIPTIYSEEYNEIVNDKTELGYLNIALFAEGYKILVKQDEEVSGRWTIYKKQNGVWHLERVQAYDNRRYIETIDWVKPGSIDPIVTDYTVDLSYQVASIIEPLIGETVKVRDSGNGRYSILQYTGTGYEIIKQEAATYKVIDAIWNEDIFSQGFDRETFDVQVFNDWPTIEIQKIVRAVYEDIFSEDEQIERNRWFLLMMNYLLAEQKYVDWLFKTSFVKVEHRNQQAISQIASLQKNRQDSLRQYIEEIKPYHTKIREFVTSHSGFDTYNSDSTDFDLPAYYSEPTGKYRSPTGLDEIDDVILDRPEYAAWLNNHTFEIESVYVHNSGSGYLEPPTLTVVGTTGTGAKVEPVIVNGEITHVEVLNPGTGFITTPVIEIGNSGGEGAKLIPILKNRKVRSIKEVIKFDRVPNNGGFMVQFMDTDGYPVDIRNQKKSRLLGEQGVIDELLDALSDFAWIRESDSEIAWPVVNVSNYRIFNDTSGRIQIQYKKTPGGWTASRLQTYLQQLGSAVGIDELDISSTTVVVDGNMSLYAPTVMEWQPNTRYDQDDIITIGNKAFVLRESVPVTITGDEIDYSDFREYNADEFESHLNRTWTYYEPNAGSFGKDLGQVIDGIEYPGVKVQGASFRAEPGYDIGNYDMAPFDQYLIGPEGVAVLDDSILDQTLYSNFLDTSLGTKPEDLITSGGKFVDTYSSHAPEEAIPGRVYDSLSIMVHTLSTNFGELSGFSPAFNINKYFTNGKTSRFKFKSDEQEHYGDYFLVYSSNYGPLYRRVEETNFAPPATVVPGGYYSIAQQRSYTVDWENKEIVFAQPLPANDLISIINIGQIGENIVADDYYEGDGVKTSFAFNITSTEIGSAMVLLNGIPVTDFTTANINGVPHIVFNEAPAFGSHIHMIATLTENAAISFVNTQYGQIDNVNRYITLNRTLEADRAKDTVMIVELNGQRLRPSNSSYFLGDGITMMYPLPNSADEEYEVLTAKVEVWVNGSKLDSSKYSITPSDFSSVTYVVFYTAPADGDDISISSSSRAEYTYDPLTRMVRVSNEIGIPAGSLLAVTTFSHHDAYRFKTKVFRGIDYSTATITVDVGYSIEAYDSMGFDPTNQLTKSIGKSYRIDSNQNASDRIFLSVGGQTLIAEQDYTVKNGVISISDNILIDDTTIVVVTWMSPYAYISSTTFRMFKDLNDNVQFNRIGIADATVLTKELNITDTKIYVADASVLGQPNPAKNIPGVLFIGDERITFWTRNGNVLSDLNRGTAGTGASMNIPAGAIVVDGSGKSQVPGANNKTWYQLGVDAPTNGLGLLLSDTVQSRFLRESKGIVPFASTAQIGTVDLPDYIVKS